MSVVQSMVEKRIIQLTGVGFIYALVGMLDVSGAKCDPEVYERSKTTSKPRMMTYASRLSFSSTTNGPSTCAVSEVKEEERVSWGS